MPIRLEARVGERPAGAVSGDGGGAVLFAFKSAAGDLGWRTVGGRGADESLLGGLLRTSFITGEGVALVSVKAGGFAKPLPTSPQKSAPLFRFEKSKGAMFSELSTSSTSEAFRLLGEDVSAFASQQMSYREV